MHALLQIPCENSCTAPKAFNPASAWELKVAVLRQALPNASMTVHDAGGLCVSPLCRIQHVCALLQIMDIKEPVMDQKGFVYEKKFIRDHIRDAGVNGQVRCPHHGEPPG